MNAETSTDSTPQSPTKPLPNDRSHRTKKTTDPNPTVRTTTLSSERRGAQTTRALPGWAIDLITDGVAPRKLWQSGNPAVVGALISTAMSAQHRNWSIMEWEALILDRKRLLVTQLRRSSGAPETRAGVRQALNYAWDQAWANRTSTPPWDRDALTEEVEQRSARALAAVEDHDNGLSGSDRAVLRYAAEQMVSRGMTRVTLPWREVEAATGLPERTTKNALKRLIDRGLLNLAERGAPSGPRSKRRRANVYEVAPNKSRGTRPVGPPVAKVGPPPETLNGTPLGSTPSDAVSPRSHRPCLPQRAETLASGSPASQTAASSSNPAQPTRARSSRS